MAKRNHLRKAAQRSYRSSAFSNPFFQKKRNIPWRGILISTGCAALIITGLIYLISGARFQIKKVSISGLENISKQAFQETILEYLNESASVFFSSSNAFLFDHEKLKVNISEKFLFADVDISTQGTEVFITVHERTSNLIWETLGAQFIVDLDGIVVRLASEADGAGELPLFVDKNDIGAEVGSSVLTNEEIEGIFLFHEHLLAQGILFYDTKVDRLAGKWVSISTQDGYSILFDPTADVDAQAKRLVTIMKTEIDDPTTLEYIDLRFGDHIYYK